MLEINILHSGIYVLAICLGRIGRRFNPTIFIRKLIITLQKNPGICNADIFWIESAAPKSWSDRQQRIDYKDYGEEKHFCDHQVPTLAGTWGMRALAIHYI